jgi:sugar phosphate isomerase/epimerase
VTRITGLEHLTMLDVAPPEFVTAAAQAGFDAVGLRVAPLDPGGQAWPVTPGSPMLTETMRRCDQTGVAVLDVEAVPLRPGSDLAGCERVLETAAVLGARYLNVICADPDTGRTADRLAELARLARPYRVRPVVEFMAWLPVRTLAAAVAIVSGSGGAGLLLDALHVQRCGVTIAEVAALDPMLLGYLQLCDAPAAPPPGADAIAEARTGRLLPGEGELPLGDLLGAVPDGLPAAAETPSLDTRRGLTPAQFAARIRRALETVLT